MGVIAVNKAGDQPLHDVETAKGFKINELVTVNAEGEFPITGGFFEVAAGTDIEYGPYKVRLQQAIIFIPLIILMCNRYYLLSVLSNWLHH